MPIATPEVYNEMLDTAKKNGFAFPAINCTSSETINAALKGFAEAESDGILIGEGTGVLVLRRLADAERDGDRVYAVIRGTGVAGDGRAGALVSRRTRTR